MKFFSTSLSLLLSVFCFAQTVTHGPLVGAVTDSSCRVFLRTSATTPFTIELSTSAVFSSIAASASGTTNGADMIGSVVIGGLNAYQKYFVRVVINSTPTGDQASFETFQAANGALPQVFLTGAGLIDLNNTDSALFITASGERAKGFIEMGDWGNPDPNGALDIYFTGPPTSWAKTYSNIQTVYKQRYSSINSSSFLRTLPIDYVYDDHDYMNERTGKQQALGYHINPFNGILGAPENWDMPAQARLNSINAYQEYFPSYNLVNASEGIYHSFKSGNTEFFVLDTRSMRGPELVSVIKVGNVWVYQPDPSSSMLGAAQMNWLKNALTNSSAVWKFIVSSVPFNTGNRFALDSLVKMGAGTSPYWHPSVQGATLPPTGYAATNNFTDMWAGFKKDADSIMSFIFSNNIKNVFVVSAGAGTVGLDDGTNAGLPELSSDNLNRINSQDFLKFQNFMGFNVWNLGGSGLCDQYNFNPTYGRIGIWANDSIRLSAVDANGDEVAGANFYRDAPYKYNPNYSPNHLPSAIVDNAQVNENDMVVITVLSNDHDPENDPLFVNVKTNPSNGSVTVNNDNTITYTPNANYVGPDTFYYHACDNSNQVCYNCATAMVVVDVVQFNAAVDLENSSSVKVFPNPACDVLYIEASGFDETMHLSLFNLLGEKMLQQDFNTKATIDISVLAQGNYFYRIETSERKLSKYGKVVVVH